MKCCNVKCLSYISAWLQLVIFIITSAGIIALLAIGDTEYLVVLGNETTVILIMAISVTWIPFFIILLIGIRKERLKLVSTFLYAAHTILVIGIVYLFYDVIMGFINKEEIGKIVLNLFLECLTIALEILLTVPIEMLHKRMKETLPDDDLDIDEEYCPNETISKQVQ